MSLKTLLAVGESFFAPSDEPSPYEVRKECQLPVFGSNLPRATAALEAAPQKELNFEGRREPRLKLTPDRRAIEEEPMERRSFLERRRRSGARSLTQSELHLEQVRVVRNDLSDSDLELAPRRAARSAEAEINPFAPRPIAAMGHPAHEKQSWGARLARLLGIRRRGRP